MGNSLVKPIGISKGVNTYDMVISWTIHNACNFSCSYCPPSLHRGDMQWLDIDLAKRFVDKVENNLKENLDNPKILFTFSGGEPTIWKHFSDLCIYIGEKGYRIGITTNGSTSVRYWDDLAPYFDQIILSYHSEFADPDNFIGNYKTLCDRDDVVTPCARLMMHEDVDKWKIAEYVYHEIKNRCRDYKIQAVQIVDDYDERSIPREYILEEQKRFLRENSFITKKSGLKDPNLPRIFFDYQVKYNNGHTEEVNENKLLNEGMCNFYGWKCKIGIEQLYINSSGEVYGGSCRIGGSYGNIKDVESITFPNEPVVCSFKWCHCASDIRVSKNI